MQNSDHVYTEKDAEIQRLQIRIAGLEKEVARLKQECDEMKAELSRSQDLCTERGQEVSTLRTQLAEARHQWDEQILATEEANAKLAEAEKAAEKLKSECVQWQEYARGNERKAAATSKAESQLSTLQEKLKVAREALERIMHGNVTSYYAHARDALAKMKGGEK